MTLPRERTKTVVTTEVQPVEPDPASPLEDAQALSVDQEPEFHDELQDWLAGFGPDGSVRAWRFKPSGEKDYCGVIGANETSLEWLQKTYGGGKYVLMYFDSLAKIRSQRRISIADPIKPPDQPFPTPATVPGMDPVVHIQLETMREEMRSSREIMLKMIEMNMSNRGDGHQGESITDLVAALASMQALTRPPDTASQMTGMLDLLKTGIEIGSTGNVVNKSEGIMDTIKEWAPLVGETIKAALAFRGAPIQPPAPAAPPTPALDDAVTAMKGKLLSGISWLKKLCIAGTPVMSVFDIMAANLHDPDWAAFGDCADMAYDDWIKLDADLAKPALRPWFEALLNMLRAEIHDRRTEATAIGPEVEYDGVDEIAAGKSGDSDHAVGNGAVDTARGNK